MLEVAAFTKLYVALRIFIAGAGCQCWNEFVAEKETWAMKRIVIWSCTAVLVIAAGLAIARADVRGWHGCFGHRRGHFGPMGYVAHELKLNDTQREQIRTMWQTEKPAISGLVHELAAEGKEMDAATAKGNVDEGKVQEIASREGTTIAKLLVEKEHFKSKVYTTVLTPEQRTKADEMQARWHERLDHMSQF
ncbi:MAG TPA: Spy/CpxP family protein refolding chaperone [Acidobacteriaceae bacterium]|jgi:Spy/CpxP family protein refolding chaperone